jgi:DNA-binding transcriptional LysR family regulator
MDDDVELRQLRYFLTVAEELNVSRAAVRLHISQPPLTRQMHRLEAQLGTRLFVRGPAGVALTLAGLALLPEARRTLAQARRAVAAARAASGTGDRRFRVGYTTVFDRSAFPEVLAEFGERCPGWRTDVVAKHSIGLVRDLRKGLLDAAFIGLHTEADGLGTETLWEAPPLLALPSGHPLAARRSIGFEALREVPFFWFERRLNPGFHDHCAEFFDRIGFTPRRVPEPPDHHVLLGLVAEGAGVALIPASLQNIRRRGVVFRRLRPVGGAMLTMGVCVAYPGQDQSAELATFLELVRRGRRAAGLRQGLSL